jgi:ribosomal-protein-serine acetyltransferase
MTRPGPSPEIVVTDRLKLTLLKKESAGVIFQVIDQNRSYLHTWLPFVDNTYKEEDTEAYIKFVLSYKGPKPDFVYEIRMDNEFAGLIAIKELDDWNKKAELGYWLDPRFEGQGIATDCCKTLISYSFSRHNLNRIQIKVGTGNSRSSRIPKRLGFKFEGIERCGEKHPDRFIDLEVYSLLRNEWFK